jgi:hypothetical protein
VYKLVRAILPSIPDEQVTGSLEFFASLRDVRSAVPALKFPEASLFTILLAVLASVAALAAFAPEATFVADTVPTVLTTVAPWVPVTSPARDPVKEAALPETFPVIFAVIVPALKFPEASLFTIVLTVLALVAALAKFAPEAMFAADTSPTVLTTVAP